MIKTFEINPPVMPEYITYKLPPRPRNDGVTFNANQILVKSLTETEALEYGELMKQTFISYWKNLQNEKANIG